MTRRFLLTVLAVAVAQTLISIVLFSFAFAAADGGREELWLGMLVYPIAGAGMLFWALMAPWIRDPWSIFAGFALGGIAWGCLVAGVLEAARRHAQRGVLAPKPALLILGQILALVGAAIVLLWLISAPFVDVWAYTINDHPVSGPEFLRRVGWIYATTCALVAVIGIALLRDATWVRPLMVVFWVWSAVSVTLFGGPVTGDVAATICMLLIAGGMAWAYLYRSENVRAYYGSRVIARSPRSE